MLWLILAILAALALYAFWFEPRSIRVVEHDIVLSRSANNMQRPLRIAVLADLQAGSPYIDEAKIERIVALTNAAAPDLVLLAGDYVIQGVLGGMHIPIERIVDRLEVLSPPLGVFAVLGNHDHWEDGAHIANVLETAGIAVLENKSTKVGCAGNTFHLVGFSDASTTAPNISRALSRVPKSGPILCFTHSPDVFPDLPPACALTIAGHTHGGQVWLPFVGRLVVPSRFGQRYASGLVIENGKTLFVSTGIGTSILPVRFFVPPEISILNVRVGSSLTRS